MRKSGIPVAVVFGLCAAGLPVFAHHSHGAFYDACNPVTAEGTVDTVQWKAPHVLVDVKTDDGVMYRAELTSPQGLSRRGIEADMVKTGERIIVIGAPLRPVDQLDPSVRPFYRDLNVKTLDVLQMRSARDAWSYALESMPTPENCSRGFSRK